MSEIETRWVARVLLVVLLTVARLSDASGASCAKLCAQKTMSCEEVRAAIQEASQTPQCQRRFKGCRLDGDLTCLSPEVGWQVNLNGARFVSTLQLVNTTFTKPVFLRRAQFSRGIFLYGVTFRDDVRLPYARVGPRGCPRDPTLRLNQIDPTECVSKFLSLTTVGVMDMTNAHLLGHLMIVNARTGGPVSLMGARIRGGTSILEVDANGITRLGNARTGALTVRMSTYAKPVSLGGLWTRHLTIDSSFFAGSVDLSDAILRAVDLDRTTFADVDFIRTHFAGAVRWNRLRFKGTANFDDARFSGPVRWSYVDADAVQLGWETSGLSTRFTRWDDGPSASGEPRPEPYVQALQVLSQQLSKRGNVHDGNTVEALCRDQDASMISFALVGFPSRWFTSLSRVAWLSGVIVSILFLALFVCGVECVAVPQDVTGFGIRVGPFIDEKPPESVAGRWTRIRTAASLTGRVYFKVGYGAKYRLSPAARRWALAGYVVGSFMLLHFLVTVKNSIPWLNDIVSHLI